MGAGGRWATPEADWARLRRAEFEKIARLGPDLIVGLSSGITQEQYATLSKIAPTRARPADAVDSGVPWQAATRLVGKAVGRTDRAGQVVAEVE